MAISKRTRMGLGKRLVLVVLTGSFGTSVGMVQAFLSSSRTTTRKNTGTTSRSRRNIGSDAPPLGMRSDQDSMFSEWASEIHTMGPQRTKVTPKNDRKTRASESAEQPPRRQPPRQGRVGVKGNDSATAANTATSRNKKGKSDQESLFASWDSDTQVMGPKAKKAPPRQSPPTPLTPPYGPPMQDRDMPPPPPPPPPRFDGPLNGPMPPVDQSRRDAPYDPFLEGPRRDPWMVTNPYDTRPHNNPPSPCDQHLSDLAHDPYYSRDVPPSSPSATRSRQGPMNGNDPADRSRYDPPSPTNESRASPPSSTRSKSAPSSPASTTRQSLSVENSKQESRRDHPSTNRSNNNAAPSSASGDTSPQSPRTHHNRPNSHPPNNDDIYNNAPPMDRNPSQSRAPASQAPPRQNYHPRYHNNYDVFRQYGSDLDDVAPSRPHNTPQQRNSSPHMATTGQGSDPIFAPVDRRHPPSASAAPFRSDMNPYKTDSVPNRGQHSAPQSGPPPHVTTTTGQTPVGMANTSPPSTDTSHTTSAPPNNPFRHDMHPYGVNPNDFTANRNPMSSHAHPRRMTRPSPLDPNIPPMDTVPQIHRPHGPSPRGNPSDDSPSSSRNMGSTSVYPPPNAPHNLYPNSNQPPSVTRRRDKEQQPQDEEQTLRHRHPNYDFFRRHADAYPTGPSALRQDPPSAKNDPYLPTRNNNPLYDAPSANNNHPFYGPNKPPRTSSGRPSYPYDAMDPYYNDAEDPWYNDGGYPPFDAYESMDPATIANNRDSSGAPAVVLITQANKRTLIEELGYPRDVVRQMNPARALDIIARRQRYRGRW